MRENYRRGATNEYVSGVDCSVSRKDKDAGGRAYSSRARAYPQILEGSAENAGHTKIGGIGEACL
ncbi:unknown [Firmicutes bacterium CAG:646]|nr:unknown [Firmicutes bacterium CAG:646]